MKPRSSTSLRRQAAALVLTLSAAVIAACGGGGGDGSAAVPAAASERATAYAAGPISGFGSVIVNGVRYDDSAASVSDDEGRSRSREQLKLGMMVEVDGTALNATAATGRALGIRFGSEIVGPVGAKTDTTLTVLGQTVEITANTVFDDSLVGGMAAIDVGEVVEVHALFDAATGRYRATRIEDEVGATAYKLRGVVADLTATTFTLGGQVVDYAGVAVADRPANLANGLRVRVRLQTTPNASGHWVATSLRAGVRKVEDRADAHLRGTVTALRSVTDFDVNGLPVNAAGARFPDGSAGVVLGAMVEVKGSVVDGVMRATEVELDDRHAAQRHRFELHGSVGALDKTARSFMLRNVKVTYPLDVAWKDGDESRLMDGARVEVKGVPSADRTQLVATRIDFED